ncbi:amino acid ABC transporter permease [Niallia sp. NCCP-28]|uniref:amino acid ABC transporter permease n=1 Tax=Niallia sp. NCCP-28 TaxID=2934712 RepID=UPI00208A4571|nr:amino acid ABC transporter permease [Niallia sp. NCCP-28]GKU82274.1 polar amino acid ABC transporter permease [Niallia sp. NCCP-28]
MDNIQLTNSEPILSSKPKKEKTIFGWLKNNLFKDWKNTLLTVAASLFSIYILSKVFYFIFTSDWEVVSNNFRLLMIGQFPQEEIWRVWVGVLFISALLGLSWGLWRGIIGHVAITIGVLLLVFCIVPYTEGNSKVYLSTSIVLMAAFYFIGRKARVLKIPTLVLWILYLPVTIGVLNGFGILEPVSTNVWGGFLLTLILATVAIVCSFPIGVLLAVGRRSKLPIIKYSCIAYIEIIRGMPLIMVLFIGQLLLPLFVGSEIQLDNVLRAMIAFTLFSAAYLAENIRGGLQSIPRGQFEAAEALGLNNIKLMVFVILPQALKAVIPAMVGQFISIFKDTSLVAVIGLTDFLGIGKKIAANPEYLGKYLEIYIFVAFFYFIFCFLMSHVSKQLEASLGVGKR